MKKLFGIFFIAILLLIGQRALADATPISFVNQPMWFSTDTFTVGATTTIYVALFNDQPSILTGTVKFYDRSVQIGEKIFSASPHAATIVSTDWQIIPGDHIFSATVTNLSRITPQNTKESITGSDISIQGKTINVADTAGKPPVPEALPDTANKVFTQVDSAQQTISNTIPSPIKTKVAAVVGTIENFRQNTALAITTNRDTLKQQIIDQAVQAEVAATKGTTPPVSSATKSPFQQVRLFFLNIGSAVFSSKFIFYGIIAFVLFMILRGIVYMVKAR